MSFTKIAMYVLFLALVALTLFNLYATATAKKRKHDAAVSFRAIIWPIEEALVAHAKSRKLNYDFVKRMLTDSDEGIVLAADNRRRIGAIATRDRIVDFAFSDIVSVQKRYYRKNRKFAGADVVLALSRCELVWRIASRTFSPRSIMGRVVYETCEEFWEALEKMRTGGGND